MYHNQLKNLYPLQIPKRSNSVISMRKSEKKISSSSPDIHMLINNLQKDNGESGISDMLNIEDPLKVKENEIMKLEYVINYLQLGIKKRDEIIKKYFEENCRLKEELKIKNTLLERYKPDKAKNIENCIDSSRNLKDSILCINPELNNQRRTRTRGESLIRVRLQNANMNTSSYIGSTNVNTTGIKPIIHSKSRGIITVAGKQGHKHNTYSLIMNNTNRVSILEMSESQANAVLNDLKVAKIENMINNDDDEQFLLSVNNMNIEERIDFVNTLRSIFSDFKNLLKILIPCRKLLKINNSVSVSLVLNDALEKIVSEICTVIGCDRASVFMIDQANNELWSKVAKGSTTTIRIPIDKGIIGHVVTTGKALIIDDAYLDPRFNKAVDLSSNYRTKTILCVPMKDFTGNIIGALQAINKLDGELFTADDESLIKLLASHACLLIKSCINNDEKATSHLKLIRVLKIGIDIYRATQLAQLISKVEAGIREVLICDKSVFYIIDQESKEFFHFNAKGQRLSYSFETGIIGRAALMCQIINETKPQNNVYFNPKIDLDSYLPILTFPIKSLNNENVVLGVIQVLNLKLGSLGDYSIKVDIFEGEVMSLFCSQVAICIEKMIKMKRLIFEKAQFHIHNAMRKAKQKQEFSMDSCEQYHFHNKDIMDNQGKNRQNKEQN